VKFGIHSLLSKETFVGADPAVMDKCRQMGFDAVEIIPFDPDRLPAAKVGKAAADLGLTISLSNEADAAVFGGLSCPPEHMEPEGLEFLRSVDPELEIAAGEPAPAATSCAR
jgi:sugar phosphate isomerase/epimerase